MDSIYSSKILLDIVSVFKNIYQQSKVILLYKNQTQQIDGIEYSAQNIKKLRSFRTNWEPNGLESVQKINDITDKEALKIFKNYDINLICPVNTSDKRITILCLCENLNTDDDLLFNSFKLLAKNFEQVLQNDFLEKSLKRSNQQTKQMISEMGALHEISRMFESSKNIDALLTYVLEKCMDLMNAEAASSMMVVEGTDELEFKTVLGPKSDGVKPFRLKIGKGLSGWVAQNNEAILIPDAYKDSRFDPSFDKRSGFRTKSMLCVPLTYKSKPIGVMTILNRLDGNPFTESDKNLLTTFASQAALAIENAQLLQATIEKERLDKELQVASEIQQLIIPQSLPKIKGLDISAVYVPCKEVSGDFYDIIKINENEYVFVVADVSGKGIPGAMLVSTMQAILKAYLEYSTDLKSIITKLNDRIIKNTTEDRFITFFFGLYHAEKCTLTYINAGHNPPILIHNNTINRLEKGGIFIGCLPWDYEFETIQLRESSILALFTDGIVEAMNDNQEEFGEDRLIDIIKKGKSLAMEEVREQLIKQVKEHRGGKALEDDLTLALFKRI
ncbi:MAG: SpoIIE family protein phosphatase [Calditrichaceae bacterium]|nr:SpoIIE family protein phosphatase [Calditrichaceae bacterium]